tara:strand:- start:55 stop:258 length:204 start_codon:yes stop_codon:yes gene_type:complete
MNTKITTLSIRETGEEDNVFVFTGHIERQDLQVNIDAWVRDYMDISQNPIENEDYFITINHTHINTL